MFIFTVNINSLPQRLYCMKQIYGNYNKEDFEVWRILYERQIKNLPNAASKAHLEGLEKVNFVADEIPKFSETNEILQDLTGWRLAVVPGIVPDYTFFELMSNKRFPATTWLRKMEELDYLEEPDMFHDVFAHVPLLTNQSFVNFLEELSVIGLGYVGNDYAIELLSRIYWFTVEFGLIQEDAGLRIYGAGILSSAGETKYSLSEEPPKHAFDVRTIANTSYRKDVFQDRYFVIESYEQLYESLPEIKAVLAEMVEKSQHEEVLT
ncbi:phenylalanine 4-hydroxylase [Marinoscillum furvescens DSM 4134]|uniref:phenylalanine 4-monooxygenase n=2 Tax=Marinoscillum furvescens TaxID=1026 RepID=A0A3D9L4A3_MARFU|nr:phenylalanine 4-hydroxylase [Marinoscillum furvescens DSM 4134]